jgi:DNA-binding SARP family transcriptional activator/tetratricopeptide (TPR) repeat protein
MTTADVTAIVDQGLRLRVLGPLEVWAGGRRVRLGGQVQGRVLTRLLLEPNKVITINRLMEAGWDGNPPATAGHQVRKVASELRQRIPGGRSIILTDGPGYRALVSEEQLDLAKFRRHLSEAREATAEGRPTDTVAALQAAVRLWRGPIETGSAESFGALSSALTERYLTALEQLLDLRIRLGEAAEVIGDLRQLVAEYPLRERLRGLLMTALAGTGRQAEALASFRMVRQMFAEELGIDPGPELHQLHELILRNQLVVTPVRTPAVHPPGRSPESGPEGDGPPPRSLPYDLPDFLGREEEEEQIRAIVDGPATQGPRIIELDGMAGTGKTSLAVHVAHRLADRFPAGQLYIDLLGFTAGQQPMSVHTALDVLLRTLGEPSERIPDDPQARIARWRVVSATRRVLLLLDNAADAAQVRPLLPTADGSLAVVTSRTRLDLDGAKCFGVRTFAQETSLALIGEVLGQAAVGADPTATEELIELCSGLPLALRLCLVRLRSRPRWTIADLVARLRNEDRLLDEMRSADRSVAASLRLSYSVMDEDQQLDLRRLGWMPGGDFEARAAGALLGISFYDAEDLLEGLLSVGMLDQREADRYSLHNLVRAFARNLARDKPDGARRAAVGRLLDYYVVAADRAATALFPGRIPYDVKLPVTAVEPPPIRNNGAIAWFAQELRNIEATLRLADELGVADSAIHLPRSFGHFLDKYGYHAESLTIAEAALRAARRTGDRLALRLCLTNVVVPLWHLGRFTEGIAYLDEAIVVAEELGDTLGIAAVLSRKGVIYNSLGRFTEGLACLERAAEMDRESGSLGSRAAALANISSAKTRLGDFEAASAATREALAINRQMGERYSEILSLVNLAEALVGLGDVRAAIGHLHEALGICDSMREPTDTPLVLAYLADAHRCAGDLDEALRVAREALERARPSSRPARLTTVANRAARVHEARGDVRAATELYRSAVAVAREGRHIYELAYGLAGLSVLLPDGAEARSCRDEADKLCRLMGIPQRHWRETGPGPVPL